MKEPSVPKLRVHNLAMSLDGYVVGPDQSPDTPLGVGGEQLATSSADCPSSRGPIDRQ